MAADTSKAGSPGKSRGRASPAGSPRPEAGRSKRLADPLLALVLLLSLTAGATDTIGFLALNGLFMAHITGNLVVLAARMVGQGQHELAQILSVPVFVTVLALTRLLAVVLRRSGRPSLAPLLLLHFLLLLGFLMLCLRLTGQFDPEAPCPVIAGMCGVAAMAVQNALVQASLPGAPATAVMTTNLTRFVGELIDDLACPPTDPPTRRWRMPNTLPAVLGFAAGCASAGFLEAWFGLRALVLPVALALAALGVGLRQR